MSDIRDVITAIYEQRMDDLSQQLASGQIDISDWQIGMKQESRDASAMMIEAATSGQATSDDFLKMGNFIKSQDKYLAGFARDIADGNVSPDAIGSRAKMYARASRTMYSMAVTADYDLPAQPGIGTDCKVNCLCSWRIVNNNDGSVDAYWERHASDSCDTCKQRAEDYYPYHIPATEQERIAA